MSCDMAIIGSNPFENFPYDPHCYCFSFLDPISFIRCATVSKQFLAVTRDLTLCREMAIKTLYSRTSKKDFEAETNKLFIMPRLLHYPFIRGIVYPVWASRSNQLFLSIFPHLSERIDKNLSGTSKLHAERKVILNYFTKKNDEKNSEGQTAIQLYIEKKDIDSLKIFLHALIDSNTILTPDILIEIYILSYQTDDIEFKVLASIAWLNQTDSPYQSSAGIFSKTLWRAINSPAGEFIDRINVQPIRSSIVGGIRVLSGAANLLDRTINFLSTTINQNQQPATPTPLPTFNIFSNTVDLIFKLSLNKKLDMIKFFTNTMTQFTLNPQGDVSDYYRAKFLQLFDSKDWICLFALGSLVNLSDEITDEEINAKIIQLTEADCDEIKKLIKDFDFMPAWTYLVALHFKDINFILDLVVQDKLKLFGCCGYVEEIIQTLYFANDLHTLRDLLDGFIEHMASKPWLAFALTEEIYELISHKTEILTILNLEDLPYLHSFYTSDRDDELKTILKGKERILALKEFASKLSMDSSYISPWIIEQMEREASKNNDLELLEIVYEFKKIIGDKNKTFLLLLKGVADNISTPHLNR